MTKVMTLACEVDGHRKRFILNGTDITDVVKDAIVATDDDGVQSILLKLDASKIDMPMTVINRK